MKNLTYAWIGRTIFVNVAITISLTGNTNGNWRCVKRTVTIWCFIINVITIIRPSNCLIAAICPVTGYKREKNTQKENCTKDHRPRH